MNGLGRTHLLYCRSRLKSFATHRLFRVWDNQLPVGIIAPRSSTLCLTEYAESANKHRHHIMLNSA